MSSDRVLPARLHARVVQVLSAMTGATGVHLLLWDDDRHGWLRPAPDGDGGTVPDGGTGREAAAPMSVLRYVQRTREPLVVADAARDRLARDPYFADVTCCSLLAVPILSRGTPRAVWRAGPPECPAVRRAREPRHGHRAASGGTTSARSRSWPHPAPRTPR